MKNTKILWMSDSPTIFTGFGTVTKELLFRFSKNKNYEIACLGWGYDGWPYNRDEIPYDIYPANPQSFGCHALTRAIDTFAPDIVISMGDLWMIDWLPKTEKRYQFQSWLYFPIDGEPFHPAWKAMMQDADILIAYTQFGQQVVRQALPNVNISQIYHGVDIETFKPINNKQSLKQQQGFANQFIVGCVARNQPRKHLPVLIKAFSRFCQDKENVMLYLHTDPSDIGWDIIDLLRRYRIDEKTAISRQASVSLGLSKQKLNEIYNLFDVMVLPTAGEGFGLPILEAMAAGIPVIATEYSACVELLKNRGEFIEVKEFQTIGRFNIEHAVPDINDLVDKLNLLYLQPDLRRQHSEKGLEFAHSLSWDIIVNKWFQVLNSCRHA